jgi:hypothetical protein
MMSKSQYRAYCYEFGVIGIITPVYRTISGIAGNRVKVIGTADIPIPFPKLDCVVIVNFDIVSQNTPSIIALADMRRAGFDSVSFQDDLRWYDGKSYKLTLYNMHWYHKWKPEDMPHALVTHEELGKLHHRFGHPSVSRVYTILKRVRPVEGLM